MTHTKFTPPYFSPSLTAGPPLTRVPESKPPLRPIIIPAPIIALIVTVIIAMCGTVALQVSEIAAQRQHLIELATEMQMRTEITRRQIEELEQRSLKPQK